MVIKSINVHRDNKKNVLLTGVILATMGNIGNKMATTGNIIILIASWTREKEDTQGVRRSRSNNS